MGGGNEKTKYFRYLTIANHILISFMENILVVDNCCDQTIININSFSIE